MKIDAVALPFKEAGKYWKSRTPVTSDMLDGLSMSARERAFAVSGLSRMDHVNSVYSAMREAIVNGETLESFKDRIAGVIEAQGWKSYRLETIFRTNAQSAYMAGRYSQMTRAAKARPFWKYSAVNDKRTRPEHIYLNGKVFPADHPFWDTWMPPNGFRCRCTVVTLSKRQVEKRGIEVETESPTGKLFEPVDPVTGVKMPARPLMPDPGFAKNTGREWLSGLSPSELEGTVKDLPGATLCRDGKGLFADSNCRIPLSEIDSKHILPVKRGDVLPAGLTNEAYVKAFLREFGLKGIGESKVHRLPGNLPVVIGRDLFIDKRTGKWKVMKSGRERYVKLLARTILSPFEIWQVPGEISRKPMPILRLLRLFAGEEKTIGGFAVFNLVGKHWQAATAFTPKVDAAKVKTMLDYLERQRQGVLLYREELKSSRTA